MQRGETEGFIPAGAIEQEGNFTQKELFPFKEPTDEVKAATYIHVNRPEGQFLPLGYHGTTSSVLLRPRTDGKILIPGIALDTTHPSLKLNNIVTSEMPPYKDHVDRWSVWLRSGWIWDERDSSRQQKLFQTAEYSPEQGEMSQKMIDEIASMYLDGFEENPIDIDMLIEKLKYFARGKPLLDHGKRLAEQIQQNPQNETLRTEITDIFSRINTLFANAKVEYERLVNDPDSALLLKSPYGLVIQADLSKQPETHIDTDIPKVIKREVDPTTLQPYNYKV